MTTPNESQRALIDAIDGCYVVDAGPGTGKTFTVARRYSAIVDREGVEPRDVLLLTFTRNAATEMRDRVVDHCDYDAATVHDAPIQTFHSLCHDILSRHGFDAPSHLGLEEGLSHSVRLLEDEAVEETHFREFFERFVDDHPEHHDQVRALRTPTSLLELLRSLAARGIAPTRDGWYRNGRSRLVGDRDALEAAFEAVNEPRNDGAKQSRLRERLAGYGRDRCYREDAPSRETIRGESGRKTVPEGALALAAEEPREGLFAFVHDVYVAYLEFALSRNYLNFAFLQLLAFVLCCEDDGLRRSLAFEYVMIDEFQDTSEIQFKLALLLSRTDNLCVVGDWKQSIYSFQDADVENIRSFSGRLERFVDELNGDGRRVTQDFQPIERIELERNYRSTQPLIDRAERALVVPGTASESIDETAVLGSVVSLEADTDRTHSRVAAIAHEDEHLALVDLIERIVGADEYAVRDGGELRPPTYGDIAVLTRTRSFGRELLPYAERAGIPLSYEGGVELFRTDPAKLVLAWLRILESDDERGWALVLEEAGYRPAELGRLLDGRQYPDGMVDFREELAAYDAIGAVARRVCARYGHDGAVADVLCETVQRLHDTTMLTRGEIIRFLERGIERGLTREVSAPAGPDAVRVQTIHAAKGLEYPIVICANVNRHAFPATGGGGGGIVFEDALGLRQRRRYDDAGEVPHCYDNWRWDVLKHCRDGGYDEERRLLYVAVTRARDHVLFTAGETPSPFLEAFPVDLERVEPTMPTATADRSVQTRFDVPLPTPTGPRGYSPHDLIDTAVFESDGEGRGTAVGRRVHAFAEARARGEQVDPPGEDGVRIEELLEDLDGEFLVEEDVYLPLSVDGDRVTIHGVVDLVAVSADRVRIIDYKTDRTRRAQEAYRTQLSVYYHVLASVYDDRQVTAEILYTALDDLVTVDPLSLEALETAVRRHREDQPVRADS